MNILFKNMKASWISEIFLFYNKPEGFNFSQEACQFSLGTCASWTFKLFSFYISIMFYFLS